jgi:glycogen(starch) synthase
MGNFWPVIGGIQVHASQFLPALQERGYEIIVVASQDSSDLPHEAHYQGIPVYRFPFWKAYNNIDQLIKIRGRLAQLRRAFAPDLIHRNAVGVGDFFVRTTANVHPAPLVVTLHGEWTKQADSLARQTLLSADWVVGVSSATLGRGRQLAPEIVARSSVIYNAVNRPVLPPEPLPVRAPRLLCLGRLAGEKGFDLALTALASTLDRLPSLRLVIAGDGPERTKLQQQAAELGISGVVEFTGWVAPEAVPALINTAVAVVIPSREEAFSLVALEAALMARPVVGVRVGGLAEVVLHEQTGLLVEKEDSEALAKAIAFLLEYPQTAAEMGQAARTRAQTIFNWERHVDAYDALYRRLIGEDSLPR